MIDVGTWLYTKLFGEHVGEDASATATIATGARRATDASGGG